MKMKVLIMLSKQIKNVLKHLKKMAENGFLNIISKLRQMSMVMCFTSTVCSCSIMIFKWNSAFRRLKFIYFKWLQNYSNSLISLNVMIIIQRKKAFQDWCQFNTTINKAVQLCSHFIEVQ